MALCKKCGNSICCSHPDAPGGFGYCSICQIDILLKSQATDQRGLLSGEVPGSATDILPIIKERIDYLEKEIDVCTRGDMDDEACDAKTRLDELERLLNFINGQ